MHCNWPRQVGVFHAQRKSALAGVSGGVKRSGSRSGILPNGAAVLKAANAAAGRLLQRMFRGRGVSCAEPQASAEP